MLTRPHRNAKIERLGALKAFRGCSPYELSHLERCTTEVEVPAGKQLCRQGEVGLEAFVIAEGEAEVSIDGHTVAILGTGDIAGEMALLDRGPRAATVTALTPLRVMVLSLRDFNNMVDNVPTAVRRLAEELSDRLREADRQPTRR